MIGYISGIVFSRSASELVIAVGDESGKIGYQLLIPDHPRYFDFEEGLSVSLHVYTHVREDALDLYGFKSQLEKNVFLALIGVNKIGPKLGLTLLTHLTAEDIVAGILKGNVDQFVKISGVGKKTGERIVLELQDQVQKKIDSGKWKLDTSLIYSEGENKLKKNAESQHSLIKNHLAFSSLKGQSVQVISEARLALMGLGYKEQTVNQVLSDFVKNNEEEISQFTTEEMVRGTLKELSRRV